MVVLFHFYWVFHKYQMGMYIHSYSINILSIKCCKNNEIKIMKFKIIKRLIIYKNKI